MTRAWPGWATVLLLLASGGCNQPFSPNMPFEKSVVAYGILSNGVAEQAIRVYTTYDSDALVVGERGPDTHLTDAVVIVSDISAPGTGSDTCQYSDQLRAYSWSPVTVARGHRYRLTVMPAEMDAVSAEVVVPGEAVVSPGSLMTLREPSTFTSDFTVSTRLAPEAKAYLVRLYVDYEFLEAGAWIPGRIEVPKGAGTTVGGTVLQWLYPNLTRRLGDDAGGDTGYQILAFDHGAYLWALSHVRTLYATQGLRFRRAVVHLTQVDVHLYNYYSIANGFQDPYTIRTDGPDYTNVAGGRGVFGAAVADSISITLPEFIR